MPSVMMNPLRPDFEVTQGCPTVPQILKVLKSHSALHTRRRGNYFRDSDEVAARHDADLARMAEDIHRTVGESIAAGGYNQELIIRRNMDASPGYDLLGSHAMHRYTPAGGGVHADSVLKEWISPHAHRRLALSRLGWSVIDHVMPDWRKRLQNELAASWSETGALLADLPEGLSLTRRKCVKANLSGKYGPLTISAGGVRIRGRFPDTIHLAAIGSDASEVLGHPALAKAGRITGVRSSADETTFLFDASDEVIEDTLQANHPESYRLTGKCA